MKNLFTWSHGPFKIEIVKATDSNLENLMYNLKIYNTLNNQLIKEVASEDSPQLSHLKECFELLNSRDFKNNGCLVDSIKIHNQSTNSIIKSFRNHYNTIVTTDEERLGSYYIDIVRHDVNYKLSEFEQESLETTYSLVFGFPFPNYKSYFEKFEISDLSKDQIAELVENISTFINK